MKSVTVAACQLPYVHRDIDSALANILKYAAKAESDGASLICFPECYLQGGIFDGENPESFAFDLSSPEFGGILQRLDHLTATVVLGLIESDRAKLYNSAVVIENGAVVGRYRKRMLLDGEREFEGGDDCPVFEVKGLRFGINICNDLNVAACARAASEQQARLLLCPCNNMMRKEHAERWKLKHNEIRSQRALETGMCLISSDVMGEWKDRVSYGPTAMIAPNGVIYQQVALMREGFISCDLEVE